MIGVLPLSMTGSYVDEEAITGSASSSVSDSLVGFLAWSRLLAARKSPLILRSTRRNGGVLGEWYSGVRIMALILSLERTLAPLTDLRSVSCCRTKSRGKTGTLLWRLEERRSELVLRLLLRSRSTEWVSSSTAGHESRAKISSLEDTMLCKCLGGD